MEIINWLKKTRGPDAIVIFVEFYDYNISEAVFALPKQKNDVIVAIKNIFGEMDVPDAEDISIDIKIPPMIDRLKETNYTQWLYSDFEKVGKDVIESAVLDSINKSWDVNWELSGFYNDGSDTWEFNFRRHTFV